MISTYLLDTNTFSYIAKGTSPAARERFLRLSPDRETVVGISAITEAEVRYGMAKHSLSRIRRSAIEGLFGKLQILSWGSAEAAAFGLAKAQLEVKGISVSAMDMLIAAQAMAAGAVLVTRDRVFTKFDDLIAVENWATDL